VRTDGRERIAAACIEWHQIGFFWVGETRHPHKYARSLSPGWYPDALLPVHAFDVKPDFTQPLWITVWVPPETKPGEYEGAIVIRAQGEQPVSVQICAKVHDVTIAPGAGHLRTSFDLLEGYLEKLYGKPLPREVARRYGKYLLQHRLNPDHFSRSDPPLMEDLRYYHSLGMNSFCVINLARHRGESIRGGLNSPPEWYTEENWHALERRLEPFIHQLGSDKELWPLAYVHGFDERDIETHGDAMRRFFGHVKQRWGLPTLTTSHIPTEPGIMQDLEVEWLCPILAQYSLAYDSDRAEKARAAGLGIWSYISLAPYPPYPNWRLDSPLMEARTIWWQVFHQNMDGFLYWGLNVWECKNNDRLIDPDRDGPFLDFCITDGGNYDWLYGDGVLL